MLRKTSKVSQGQKRTTQDDLAQAVLDGDIYSVEQILDSFVALLGKRYYRIYFAIKYVVQN